MSQQTINEQEQYHGPEEDLQPAPATAPVEQESQGISTAGHGTREVDAERVEVLRQTINREGHEQAARLAGPEHQDELRQAEEDRDQARQARIDEWKARQAEEIRLEEQEQEDQKRQRDEQERTREAQEQQRQQAQEQQREQARQVQLEAQRQGQRLVQQRQEQQRAAAGADDDQVVAPVQRRESEAREGRRGPELENTARSGEQQTPTAAERAYAAAARGQERRSQEREGLGR